MINSFEEAYNHLRKHFCLFLFAVIVFTLLFLEILRKIFNDYNYPPLNSHFRYILLAGILISYILYVNLLSRYFSLGKLVVNKNLVLFSAILFVFLSLIPPILSIDLYEYVMRGRMSSLYGLNPFLTTPSAVPGDALFNIIFWKNEVSVYGPLWSSFAWLITRLTGSNDFFNILGFKFFILIFYGLSCYVLYKLAKNIAPKAAYYITAAFMFNPYLMFMNLVESHNDIIIIFFLIAGLYCLSKKKYILAVLMLDASIAVKYVTVLLLPLFIIYIIRNSGGVKKGFKIVSIIIIVNFIFAYFVWVPFNMSTTDIMCLLEKIKFRLDTNTIPYITYSFLKFFWQELDMNIFRRLADIAFMVISLFIYLNFCVTRRYSLRYLITSSLVLFIAYYIISSFQFGSWYIIWITPLILLSKFPKKIIFMILVTLAGLISFWKRISFLLILSAAGYLFMVLQPKLYNFFLGVKFFGRRLVILGRTDE
ncbi:conserved hypothetical protein, membrane [Candidatus Omnitrophus magneticus]|uniref:Glycosyltransferase RgtA/B/C/D-like domain-containing protein n=1 Tax=Candidatus Omnitrophus magneticus TaxID=1609969 RepID=A0A0F0CTS5_9BACT|nr:conserved hypothetical protein, membrane [Candidatus Omnitrophus magneticus]